MVEIITGQGTAARAATGCRRQRATGQPAQPRQGARLVPRRIERRTARTGAPCSNASCSGWRVSAPPMPDLLGTEARRQAETARRAGPGRISPAHGRRHAATDPRAMRPLRRGQERARTASPGSKCRASAISDPLRTLLQPVPPEPIVGYITIGRGVTVHRARCANLARMRAAAPARVLEIGWGTHRSSEVPVEIGCRPSTGAGLLRDVSRSWRRRKSASRHDHRD